ncbi:hypothetical protein Hanom_Chr07g00584491 [Helianthus anomalus]
MRYELQALWISHAAESIRPRLHSHRLISPAVSIHRSFILKFFNLRVTMLANFLSDFAACNLVWCGDGDCVVSGNDHYCQCHDRAANLLHNPKFICMQQCYLDGDCNHLGLFPPPPPPSSVASPGPSGGKNGASYSFTKLPAVLVAIFTGVFLTRT